MNFDHQFLSSVNVKKIANFLNHADQLGEKFVTESCKAIYDVKDALKIKESTWFANYVKPLGVIFDCLVEYEKFKGLDSLLTPQKQTVYPWGEFCEWLTGKIEGMHLTPGERNKAYSRVNNVFYRLARANVIPITIRLERSNERKQTSSSHVRKIKIRESSNQKFASEKNNYGFYISSHGREYDFSMFNELGEKFICKLLPVLENCYAKRLLGDAKHYHTAFCSFLKFLLTLRSHLDWASLLARTNDQGLNCFTPNQWEIVVYQWRDSLFSEVLAGEATLLTSHRKVKNFAALWNALNSHNLVPAISIVGFKNARKRTDQRNIKSLAQLALKKTQYETAEQVVFDRLAKTLDDCEKSEAHEFIRSLCSEFSAATVARLSVPDFVGEIHKLNSKRLSQVRMVAESKFLQWLEHWEIGQRALSNVTFEAEELVAKLDSASLNATDRRRNSKALLFTGEPLTRLGNSLMYTVATQQGIISGVFGRFHHLKRSFGGHRNFHAYLHPHPHATIALWIMLMIDTGANCEVVRNMPWDCLKMSSDPEYKQVEFSNKRRSGGKLILDLISIAPFAGQKLSSVEAIELYKKMACRYHAQANAAASERLFIREYSGRVSCLEEWTARAWFRELYKTEQEFHLLSARPSMIRPSVLMTVQHNSDNDILAAKVVADHSQASTTFRYTGRMPAKMQYNLAIRRFQDLYQAVVIVSIEGAVAKLGLTDDEFKIILSDAARTGLGVACLDNLSGVQPGTEKGQACTRFDACWNCEMRWVVGTIENIKDLILFNKFLHEQENTSASKYPDVWEQRWLPWLVFSDIALGKLSQGETAKVFSEAQLLSERVGQGYSVTLF